MNPDIVEQTITAVIIGVVVVSIIVIGIYILFKEIQRRIDHDAEVSKRLNGQKRHKK